MKVATTTTITTITATIVTSASVVQGRNAEDTLQTANGKCVYYT